MNTVSSESELQRCFREIDRAEVELSPDLAFPLAVDEARSWAVGPRAYLVFRERPGAPLRGIVFHRNSGALPDAAAMCEWCHSVRGNGNVKLMSVQADARRRIGLYLCSDLGCVSRAHELPSPDDLPERLSAEERSRRSLRRIVDFAARRLF
jgi:treble-clef zinc-finger protein